MCDYKIWHALVAINFLSATSRAYSFGYVENYEGSGYYDDNAHFYGDGWVKQTTPGTNPTHGESPTDYYQDEWECYPEICQSSKPMCCHENGRNYCCTKYDYDYLMRRNQPSLCLGSHNIYYTGVRCPVDTTGYDPRYLCCPGGLKCCTATEYTHMRKDNHKKNEENDSNAAFQGRMVGVVTIVVVMVGAAIAIVSKFIKTRKNRRLNITRADTTGATNTATVADPPPPYPAARDGGVYNENYVSCPDVIIGDNPPEYREVMSAPPPSDVTIPPPAYVTDYESSAESTTSKPN